MLSDLMPNISRHFLYSILEHNQASGMAIIDTIIESKPEDVGEFLFSLGNCIATYFFQLETGLEGYNDIRIQALKDLKNMSLEEDLESVD
ncbi:MAG: hypothetical protein CO032_02140 [Nitrosopumilales archaeon CG_4_9_14_0_2_um_filter_34_16]|nr:MAG: hypothetical protein CO032_02140 [Nitrosopumilales archaeon CG_4_9_14_0_2_um_filter_34_16]